MDEKQLRIVDLLKNKAAMKQDIADYSESVMDLFREEVVNEIADLKKEIKDKRVRLRIDDRGTHEFFFYIGSDVLVFQLHHNIFRLPDENPLWKTDYLKENESNGYFGIINIYNFLAESFERKRYNDAGYLIGRVFINQNNHFVVEGKGQLGFLFRDLKNKVLTHETVRQIIQTAIIYSIEFDLITPPYDLIQEMSVMEIQTLSSELQVKTGKRLGFKFSAEGGKVE